MVRSMNVRIPRRMRNELLSAARECKNDEKRERKNEGGEYQYGCTTPT
jgi:hypothetical protein